MVKDSKKMRSKSVGNRTAQFCVCVYESDEKGKDDELKWSRETGLASECECVR